MQILTERFSFDPGGRYMRSHPVNRKHQKREHHAFPELRYIKYVLDTGEHGLYHLGLSAGSLNFFHCALAELMRTHGKLRLQFSHAEHF